MTTDRRVEAALDAFFVSYERSVERRIAALEAERDELAVRIDGAEIERDEWRLRGVAAEKRRDEACEAAVLHMRQRYHAEKERDEARALNNTYREAAEDRTKIAFRNALEMAAQHLTEVADGMFALGQCTVADLLRVQADKVRALSDSEPAK